MNKIPSAAMLRARRVQKKGVKFTVMVCGVGGCGKSTFINTLCGREVISRLDEPVDDLGDGGHDRYVKLQLYTEELPDQSNGVLTVKFIETTGFGNSVDNREGFQVVSSYVEEQFDQVLAEESRIRRNPKFTDNRVHALVYLIVPTGHGLREIDVEFMKLMAPKVNVIPVIAKSDSLTPQELYDNKRLILEDIENYHIPIYQFPTDSDLEGEAPDEALSNLGAAIPFSIIGGTELVNKQGKSVLCRKYPWGYLDVEDPAICDFSLVRDVLLSTHTEDLKETTHDFLYETYRTEKLSRAMDGVDARPKYGAVETQARPVNGNGNHGLGIDGSSRNVSASYVVREEQLRLEEEKLRSIELKVQEEIARKRQDLIKKEQDLRELEVRVRDGLHISRENSMTSQLAEELRPN